MRSNLLLILGLCAGTLQQIVLPYPTDVCYEKDEAPVDVDVLYDDDCKDNDGNTYSQDSELYSCCDCFRYKCEEIDYWGKQKKVGWVRSVSEQCCQNCNGTVYPSNTVLSTTMLEDDCLTTQTEVCRVRPGLKTAVIEQEFSYRNCCNDNTKSLQYLGAVVPEPRTCSIRICEYEESWPHSVWITEKELEGCDCCLLPNGTMVADGATWVDNSVTPSDMKECCRGQIVTPATYQTTPVFTTLPQSTEPPSTETPAKGLSGDVTENTQIGFIKCWGPLFRVSVDLFIKEKAPQGKFASVLEFKGYRNPAILLKEGGDLHICNSVSGKSNYYFNHYVGLNQWRNIVLEQTEKDGKIYYTVSVEGKQIHSVENTDHWTIYDVRVQAGHGGLVANVSYKNLEWTDNSKVCGNSE